MNTVIVTGGAGFVGSHLCDLLLSQRYAVLAIDNFVTGRRQNVAHLESNPNFRLLEWDVSLPLPASERARIDELRVSAVLHFACPASPVDFDRIPFEILAVDSDGTREMVELALAHKARFVLASTSEIYGDPLEHPQREDYWGNCNSVGPRACYDEAKRFSEAFVSSAMRPAPSGKIRIRGREYAPLNGAIVRIFNTYGPRMRPDDGRIVPELCLQALRGQDLTIHGDGTQTRSFCYVSDLVAGIVELMHSAEHRPVNLGNPSERSVEDFARAVLRATGSKSKVVLTAARPEDPRKRCPDISRAREVLGWEPRIGFEEGLQKTIDYFRDFV